MKYTQRSNDVAQAVLRVKWYDTLPPARYTAVRTCNGGFY